MDTFRTPRRIARVWACLAIMTPVAIAYAAPAEIVHTVYRPDQPFPEFIPMWHEGWNLKGPDGQKLQYAGPDMPLGGYIHVYVKNNTPQPLAIKDVRLEGVSLTEAVCLSKDEKAGIHPANVRFAKIPQEQINRLIELGEPVWWKVDPHEVPPGSLADVTIRLRRNPPIETVAAEILCNQTPLPARINVRQSQPYLAGISFALDFNDAIAYIRTPGHPGVAPTRFTIDGLDVTAQSTILADPALDTAIVTTRLSKPVEPGSFHYFQADFADGSRAAAGLRAVADEFRYGMWGYINNGNTPKERADYFLKDMEAHNINVLMYSISRDVSDFLMSQEGLAYSQRTGLRMMASWPGNARKPVYYFLLDEPDAQDAVVNSLEPTVRLGALGQGLIAKAEQIRAKDPVPPILLNIDGTFKPENWYMYGQLPDVMCADPYYSGELASVFKSRLQDLPHFEKPTYVYAVATISRWACAPRPLHIILNCVRNDDQENPFRFSTPLEKRIEVYYALAAGATSLSYWWYTPYDQCYGVGGDDPRGKALWREMGLLGAEVRTAGPLLMRSCPADLPMKASPDLWVRTLLAGPDAIVALVVNDTARGNKISTTIRTVSPATVELHLPAWFQCDSVFEIDSAGTKDLKSAEADGRVTLDLGQVQTTRLVVLARDGRLREQLQKLYDERFAETVRKLKQRK